MALWIPSTTARGAPTPAAELEELRRQAAEGSSVSQYRLGLIHADTAEPVADLAEAYVWMSLAVRGGASDRELARLTARMTPEELAEGRRRYEERSAAMPGRRSQAVPEVAAQRDGAAPVVPAAATVPAPVVSAPGLVTAPRTPVPATRTDEELASLRSERRQLQLELSVARRETDRAREEAAERQAQLERALAERDREIAAVRERLEREAGQRTGLPVPASADGDVQALRERLEAKERESDLLRARLLAATAIRLPVSPDNQAASPGGARSPAEVAERERLRGELERANAELSELRQRLASASGADAEALRRLTEERSQLRTELEAASRKAAALAEESATAVARLTAAARSKDEAIARLETDLRRATEGQPATERLARDLQVAQEALRKTRETEAELRARLERTGGELERSRSEVATAEQRVSEETAALRARETSLRAQLAERDEELQRLRATPAGTRAEGDLLRRLAEAEEDRNRLAQSLATVSLEAAALKVQVGELRPGESGPLRKLNTELERTRRRLDEAAADLEAERRAKNELGGRLTQARSEIERLRREEGKGPALADARREVEQARQRVGELEAEQASLRQQLRAETERSREAAAELARLGDEVERLRERAAGAEEASELRRRLEQREGELAGAARRADEAEGGRAAALERVSSLLEEVQALRAASLSEERAAELRSQIGSLQRSVATITAEREEAEERLAAERRARVDAAIQAGKLMTELETLRRELPSPAQIADLKALNDSLRRSLASSEAERDALAQQIAAVRRSYARQTADFDRALQALTSLETERSSSALRGRAGGTETPSGGPASRMSVGPQGDIVLVSPPRVAPESERAAPSANVPRIHTVAEGDSLSGLARRYYGSPNRWVDILAANRDVISNPNALRVGSVLRIP